MATNIDDRYELFIDGEAVGSTDGEYMVTRNPATDAPLTEFAAGGSEDIDRAVEAARESSVEWRSTKPAERGRILRRIADEISQRTAELARIESLDQGKPYSQAQNDVQGTARFFEYYAGVADKLEGKSFPMGDEKFAFTAREPYGVSGQIVPWNFPLSLTARGVAPALVTGNTVVVKPAPTTPLSALHLAQLCHQAGLPSGVLNVVTGGAEPGAALSGHDGVDVLTFTGSVRTGQTVMEAAASDVTPVTLELGGKNPAVVLSDADLEKAVAEIATGIFGNAGQICSGADRALVHESIYREFVDRMVERAESYDLGPGTDDPDMGPLNHAAHFESVLEYVEIGREEGATLETGGVPLDRDGHFLPPTVFSDVETGMRIAQEEIFGPVLAVIPFSDREEAVTIANDVEFGLSAGVFSTDVRDALALARDVDAGNVWINEWFGGSVQTPFGGMKRSGIGREKGLEGLRSYLQSKTISVALDE